MTSHEGTIHAVRELLVAQVGDVVEAAFVYGSVAAGTATADSDLDCFVLLHTTPAPDRIRALRAAFHELQTTLGYTPDPAHPVEVFTTMDAVTALNEVLLLRALVTAARDDDLDDATLNSDCLEVLRALLNRRLTITGSLVLDSLTTLAWHRADHGAALYNRDTTHVTARLGVRHPASRTPEGRIR